MKGTESRRDGRISRRILLFRAGVGTVLLTPAVVAIGRFFLSNRFADRESLGEDTPAPVGTPAQNRFADRESLGEDTFTLSFDGPFSMQRPVVDQCVEKSWIQICEVFFTDIGENGALNIVFGLGNGKRFVNKIRSFICCTANDGAKYVLDDQVKFHPARQGGAMGGAWVVMPTDGALLPVPVDRIAKLSLRYSIAEEF